MQIKCSGLQAHASHVQVHHDVLMAGSITHNMTDAYLKLESGVSVMAMQQHFSLQGFTFPFTPWILLHKIAALQ